MVKNQTVNSFKNIILKFFSFLQKCLFFSIYKNKCSPVFSLYIKNNCSTVFFQKKYIYINVITIVFVQDSFLMVFVLVIQAICPLFHS